MRVDINELAKMAGVAKSTISKALNNQQGVSEKTRERICSLASELNYKPSAAAKALAGSKRGVIGLVLPGEIQTSLRGEYWSTIITSVTANVSNLGFYLMVITGKLEDAVQQNAVDGLIIGADTISKEALDFIASRNIPFVFIGQSNFLKHWAVDSDNFSGSKEVTKELISKGIKKICCLTGPADTVYTKNRIAGFNEALTEAGITPLAIVSSDYETDNVRKNTLKLLDKIQNKDLDAIFIAAGGDFALTVCETLKLEGLDPSKILFGIFDDSSIFDFLQIAIVAARQPLYEMGKEASRILFKLIEGETPDKEVRFLPVQIVLR